MKRLAYQKFTGILGIFFFIFFIYHSAFADDTCTFTTSDVTPNIVILLDNGAETENIDWHGDFDNNKDFTPAVAAADQEDVGIYGNGGMLELTNITEGPKGYFQDGEELRVLGTKVALVDGVLYDTTGVPPTEGKLDYKDKNAIIAVGADVKGKTSGCTATVGYVQSGGNGFFNDRGYIMDGGDLRPVLIDLQPDTTNAVSGLAGVFSINGRSITLPAVPSSSAVDGVIDNASQFRYSKNYLNWLFFYSTGTLDLNNIDESAGAFLQGEILNGSSGAVALVDAPLNGSSLRYYGTGGTFSPDEIVTGAVSGATAEVVTNTVNADAYTGNGGDLPTKSRFYYAKKAIMDVIKTTVDSSNTRGAANFGLFNFSSATNGANNALPIKADIITTFHPTDPEQNALDPNWVNNLNNMGTVDYSPLAKGLANIGSYFNSATVSSYVDVYYCQKNFALVISSGLPSYDGPTMDNPSKSVPNRFDADDDNDALTEGEIDGTPIPLNIGGYTYLDDVAAYMYDNKIVYGGYQNVMTYTLGFMSSAGSNKYLINTSNNGNGFKELYDSSHPEYGKYHFEATDAEGISEELRDAISEILSRTNTFTAPVVPVTRTTSGSDIYLAFFKPVQQNFWEGDVSKFGIDLDTLQITDVNGDPATYSNGALKETAEPYWSTKDWARDPVSTPVGAKPNGIHNSARNIYTYLGYNKTLADGSNHFKTTNTYLTDSVMGYPTSNKNNIINYIRGADVYDEDDDGLITENRAVITGDVLHSEPAVFQYLYSDGSSKTMVFFGSNDGMLHAVYDIEVSSGGTETLHGSEAWAFIPPDQLNRLKDMIEGIGHQYYIDSSPQIYFKNVNMYDNTVDAGDGDKVILICGERKGGNSYFALDITNPLSPVFLWRIGYSSSGTLMFSNIYQYDAGTAQDGYFKDNDPLVEYCPPSYGSATVDGTLKGILAYDNLTGTFSVGDIVSGATSGAKGTITSIDAGTGTLSLEDIRHKTGAWGIYGAFNDDEDLIVAGNVIASANGILYDISLNYDNLTMPFTKDKWVRNIDPYVEEQPLAYGYIQTTIPLNPDVLIPELGESWSEPQFGLVLMHSIGDAGYAADEGTPVMFIGGGYSSDNSKGNAVLAINVETGAIVKMWSSSPDSSVNTHTAGMNYSFASSVRIIDSDSNGFIDKLYIGDLGGRMWRFGNFTDSLGALLDFPDNDENINNWTGQVIFNTGCGEGDGNCINGADDNSNGLIDEPRKLFYPPSVTLQRGYDLVFMATGDRENACDTATYDGLYAVKDDHSSNSYEPGDLINVTDEATAPVPNLDGPDLGWYINLSEGEKALSTGIVFYKTYYMTTFRPWSPDDLNYDPCLPGGPARLYAVDYKTSGSVFDGGTSGRSIFLGGGIPSRPVMIIPPCGIPKLFVSVGSTDESNPDSDGAFGAGVVSINPLAPSFNFFYVWWKEL